MYEVRLHKSFVESSIMLAAAGIHHDDYDGMITCWFKEEIDWCKERNLHVLPRLDLKNWEVPTGDKMKAIARKELQWSSPDVCFLFPDDKDAILFKLRWI